MHIPASERGMGYTWFSQHKGSNVSYDIGTNDLGEALRDTRGMAEAAAMLGYDAFYRLFGPNGFVTAFSVLDGKVTEWKDVTFPKEHF